MYLSLPPFRRLDQVDMLAGISMLAPNEGEAPAPFSQVCQAMHIPGIYLLILFSFFIHHA